ncbi:MAG: patatin-like phospholipase family protein [Alphaproteobacteria bacterium]|nr:patatin-like phospholipase family protein [Alphaproteobacteria bacterium]
MALALSSGAVAACDAPARLASLPEKLRAQARFEGLPAETRVILDGSDDTIIGRTAIDALQREIAYDEQRHIRELGEANFLAISGGGDNGAYGAGLLTAWTELGTRPDFKAVTGVSTGALIAPFAYLGPAYDKDLERFYTAIGQKDVMLSRGLISGVLGESLFDSTPLLNLIRSALTPRMVGEIGREYAERGRLLFVATTNLDVPVGVMWNIGGIAASGNERAAELIARVLLASASIPGAFPPVMIDFEESGQRFQEMHVDGGTVAQVVFYPPSFSVTDLPPALTEEDGRISRAVLGRKRRLHVIRNSRSGAEFESVNRRTLTIAGRAVSTLINAQGIGDMYQLFVVCQRDGVDFNATWIPPSFTDKPAEPFERGYMNRLYQVGRQAMLGGTAWSKYPPGYNPTPLRGLGQRLTG